MSDRSYTFVGTNNYLGYSTTNLGDINGDGKAIFSSAFTAQIRPI